MFLLNSVNSQINAYSNGSNYSNQRNNSKRSMNKWTSKCCTFLVYLFLICLSLTETAMNYYKRKCNEIFLSLAQNARSVPTDEIQQNITKLEELSDEKNAKKLINLRFPSSISIANSLDRKAEVMNENSNQNARNINVYNINNHCCGNHCKTSVTDVVLILLFLLQVFIAFFKEFKYNTFVFSFQLLKYSFIYYSLHLFIENVLDGGSWWIRRMPFIIVILIFLSSLSEFQPYREILNMVTLRPIEKHRPVEPLYAVGPYVVENQPNSQRSERSSPRRLSH